MKKTKRIITLGFLVYIAIIFFILYNTDKQLLAIFCALGTSVYVAVIKRFSNKH